MHRLAVLDGDGSDESMKTFVLFDVSHTFGNVLTSIITQYPDVEFCGYTVPHPAEQRVHLRIQTKDNCRAVDILNRGLEDLEKVCDDVIDKFQNSLESYKDSKKVMDSS